jgi:hypothetical protein
MRKRTTKKKRTFARYRGFEFKRFGKTSKIEIYKGDKHEGSANDFSHAIRLVDAMKGD